MGTTRTLLTRAALILLAAQAANVPRVHAQSPHPSGQTGVQPPSNVPPPGSDPTPRVAVIPGVVELSGLPKDSKPEVLTWERVYAYALAKKAGGQSRPVGPAGRLDVNDAGSFRKVFLEADPAFRDPADDVLGLLQRYQRVDSLSQQIAVLEGLNAGLEQLKLLESLNIGRNEIRIEAKLQRARLAWIEERRAYRDRLDAVKVSLGLAPDAAVVPDLADLAAFRDVFTTMDEWQRDPARKLAALPGFAERLPVLSDVILDGRPLIATVSARPDEFAAFEATAVRLARGLRGQAPRSGPLAGVDPNAALTLRVRSAIRRLVDLHAAYQVQKRALVLALQGRDGAFERLIAPPAMRPGDGRPGDDDPLVANLNLFGFFEQIQTTEADLVSTWADYQSARMALHRDLGTTPGDGWKGVLAGLRPRPAAPPTP